MRIAYISEKKIYLCEGGAVRELPCKRVAHYIETVRTINKNKEWKYTGTGARFTGAVREFSDDEASDYSINGLAWDGRGLVYSGVLGEMGNVYRMNPDKPDAAEEHIYNLMNTGIGRISFYGDRFAAEMNGHIALYDSNHGCSEITEGDSVESAPSWSADGRELLCVSKGIAVSEKGMIFSPGAVLSIDLAANTISEIFSSEKTDCALPRRDRDGNLWLIRQPYKSTVKKTPLWKDILLFPVRIIKAIGGFLNAFSVIFGGEPLRDGRKRSDVKSKQKSEKELFFEGRLIEAEKNQRENASKGEENPGIFPLSRELIKISPDGEETVVRRGVQDYLLLENGELVISNGRSVIHIGKDGETVLAKAELAHSLCRIPEADYEN